MVEHTTDPGNGVGEGIGNILFTAPSNGIASIGGMLWNARDLGRPQAWDLRINGLIVASNALLGVPRSSPETFSLTNVAINTGDLVDLEMFLTGSSGDFVGFDLNVDLRPRVSTGVPEPATLALFGAGLAGLGALRRRKAKA